MIDRSRDITVAWCKEFGDRLKRLIHNKGMTQGQFARKLGVTEATLSRYIKGIHIPNALQVEQIANILGCDVNRLYDKTF